MDWGATREIYGSELAKESFGRPDPMSWDCVNQDHCRADEDVRLEVDPLRCGACNSVTLDVMFISSIFVNIFGTYH